MSLQLKICSDDCGTWSVHGLPSQPVKHLPSLSASIDYARNEMCGSPGDNRVVDRRILRRRASGTWVAASADCSRKAQPRVAFR
jgi:hypothetical protein